MKRVIAVASLAIVAFFYTAYAADADVIGQRKQFSISSQFDAQGRFSVDATVQHVSGKAYFYVEDEFWNLRSSFQKNQLLTSLSAIGAEFDSVIYPTEVAFFGSEPNPGIDGDSRITILVTPLDSSVGGYFDSTHAQPKSFNPESNEREMFYVNSNEVLEDRK